MSVHSLLHDVYLLLHHLWLYTQSLTTKASESTPDDAHDDDDDDADDDQLLAGQDIDPDRLKSFNVSSYTEVKVKFE